MLPALADAGLAAGHPLPIVLSVEIERLQSLQSATGQLLAEAQEDTVSALLAEARPAPYPACRE
jgi:hypothetical protein